MRIVFALHAPRDPETAVFAYTTTRAAYLESLGHEVEIWSQDDDPRLARIRPRWWPFVFSWHLASRLAENRFDVVIFHSYLGWAFHLRRMFSRRFRQRVKATRTIAQFHGVETLEYQAVRGESERAGKPTPLRHHLLQTLVLPRLLHLGCRGADRVFCLNQAERRYFAARGWAHPERTEIVPNAAPDEILGLARRNRPRPAKRLLFLGQWLERKGVRQLAEAFSALGDERPNLTLACVGTRTPESVVRAAFPAHLNHRIEVRARATRAEVASELSAADLFVFPSFYEGSSLALLEAMAAELPIVATPVGAATDLLAPNGALFVEVGDSASLASAIRRVLDEEELRESLAKCARSVAETLAWSRLCEAYGQSIAAVGRMQQPRRGS